MGLFDSVYVDCPHCDKKIEHQSKADIDPCMNSFTISDAPAHILRDVLNDPHYCRGCGKWHVLFDPDFPPNYQPPRPSPSVRKVRDPKENEFYAHSTQNWLRWWDVEFSETDISK